MLKLLMIYKRGLPLERAELDLIRQMEKLKTEFSTKEKFGERLSKLMKQSVKLLQDGEQIRGGQNNNVLDQPTLDQIKEFLAMQQKGIKKLFDSINRDTEKVSALIQSINYTREAIDESRKQMILENLR